jgi:two-component system, NarL family, sensor histidine kinase DegS
MTSRAASGRPKKKGLARYKGVASTKSFWILAAMMAGLAALHYLTPQTRLLPFSTNPAGRHAVERIIFILPITSATFAFGQAGGIVTLILALVVMIPRIVFVSPYPADALLETLAVAIVGYVMIWMINVQEREKTLRQEAVSRLKTINAITSLFSGTQELEQSLEGALGQVLEFTQASLGCIYLLDAETRDLVLAVCRGAPQLGGEVAGFELGESLIEWVLKSGQPTLINNLDQEPPVDAHLPDRTGLRSILAVPLKSRDNVLGFMYLADPEPDRFTTQDLHLLHSISNEIGVAIENARLHHDVARQLRIEQKLNEVAEQITSELELDRVLPKVLQIARDLVGADAGVIALVDSEKNIISYPYVHNLPPSLAAVTVPRGVGLSSAVMNSGRPVVIEDYPTFPNAIPAFVAAGVTSVVGVPLVSGDRIFGALDLLGVRGAKRFSERDVAILEGIGRQAGIAIENAQLYENMRYYIQQVTRAQEDERKRIARELHDDTVQNLIVLSRRLEGLAIAGQIPQSAKQLLEQLQTLAGDIIQSVRRFSRDLRPATLDDLGLVPTLEGLTASLSNGDAIKAELQVLGEKRRLSPEGELTLFRIAQEAYSNIVKHAGASHVWTTVEFSDCAVCITIRDDGKGFRTPTHTADLAGLGKLGLVGMHERARLLGGTLVIESQPEQGTCVSVSIPNRA